MQSSSRSPTTSIPRVIHWHSRHFSFPDRRLIREQPGVDDFEGRAGPAAGHRRIAELGQVGARSPLPDRQLHAGGVARRRSIQERDPDRQPELLAADTGRRRRT